MKTGYCVYNHKEKSFLNYAEKKKLFWRKGIHYYVVHSPYPTLRPRSHIIKHFQKWIENTPKPEHYEIVRFKMNTKRDD